MILGMHLIQTRPRIGGMMHPVSCLLSVLIGSGKTILRGDGGEACGARLGLRRTGLSVLGPGGEVRQSVARIAQADGRGAEHLCGAKAGVRDRLLAPDRGRMLAKRQTGASWHQFSPMNENSGARLHPCSGGSEVSDGLCARRMRLGCARAFPPG